MTYLNTVQVAFASNVNASVNEYHLSTLIVIIIRLPDPVQVLLQYPFLTVLSGAGSILMKTALRETQTLLLTMMTMTARHWHVLCCCCCCCRWRQCGLAAFSILVVKTEEKTTSFLPLLLRSVSTFGSFKHNCRLLCLSIPSFLSKRSSTIVC